MTKLIFGCGYLGRRVAERWRNDQQQVRVATRSAEKAAAFTADGLQGVVADILTPASISPQLFEDVDTVLFAVGFDRQGGTIREVYANGLRNVLAHCPASVQQFIYISSTGVYGKGSGEVIDEQSPTVAERDGGRACLEAESALQTSSLADRGLVLRLAGIYGPNRIPRVNDILERKPITALAASWLNLIHVDDAADIVVSADRQRIVADLLNVSDGHPVQRRDFYRELATLLKQPAPEFIEPAPEEAALTRGGDKRISNERLMAALQPVFRYPSYREGLAAIVAAMS